MHFAEARKGPRSEPSENLRLSRSSELHYGPKQDAIARLDEKALRGGGKSEYQPLLEKCRTTLDVRAKRRKLFSYWLSAAMRTYVYYYISSWGDPAARQHLPVLKKIGK